MQEVRVITNEMDLETEIEFHFKSKDQLLDAGDPYPLPERELTEFAESFIVRYVDGHDPRRVAGIAVLFFYVFIGYFRGFVMTMLAGLVTILNWVTIWDTYEYIVYDYRRELQKYLIYRKLTEIDIRFVEW